MEAGMDPVQVSRTWTREQIRLILGDGVKQLREAQEGVIQA